MKNIIVDHKDRVGIIYLNRQEYLNAFDDLMGYELRVQIQKFNSDPHIGSILVSGMGRAFSAGADVGGFEATVNGEQKENRIIPYVIKNALSNKTFYCSTGKQIRDFIYIDDVISAIFKSIAFPKKVDGKIINIGYGKGHKLIFIINCVN